MKRPRRKLTRNVKFQFALNEEVSPMQCPKCGYMLQPFDVECPRCFRVKQAPPSVPVISAPSSNKKNASLKALYLLIGVLSLLCVLLIGVLAVNIFSPKETPVAVVPPTPSGSPPTPVPFRNEPESIRPTAMPPVSSATDVSTIRIYLNSLSQINSDRVTLERREIAEAQGLRSSLAAPSTNSQYGTPNSQLNEILSSAVYDWDTLRNCMNRLQVPSTCVDLHNKYQAFLTQADASLRNTLSILQSATQTRNLRHSA